MKKIKFRPQYKVHGQLMLLVSALMIFVSCSQKPEGKAQEDEWSQSIKMMNWNLQTFFDATFDGNEYSEFKNPKSGWNKEKYEERLDRLADVIKEIDADVVIMEELEKESQLQDIANRLSGTFDFSKLYQHGLFAISEGSSIGCAVLSRLPIGEVTVHSLDIRTNGTAPSMRPIIQFSLYLKEKTLTIFVNHWKSKSSGSESSEIWRKKQEILLARLMSKAKNKGPLLACGDFNKDISEFDISFNKEKERNLILHGKNNIEVFSPWILENGSFALPGSYWYKNNWERIDHFFASGKILLSDFCAENTGKWADSEGRPLRYQQWNGRGYSDHLPITCVVRF